MVNNAVTNLVGKFIDKPLRMNMGAGKLSRRYSCSKEDVYEARKLARITLFGAEPKKGARILLFDIETAPLKAFVWRLFKQNIYLDQMMDSTYFMLTWAAKWLDSDELISDSLTGKEAIAQDDKRIVSNLRELLDQADIVIAHFGDHFDIPMFNARCIVNGILPPKPYRTIDTKNVSSKQFKFASNKLDALGRIFGFKRKLDTDFPLWDRCYHGDEEALAHMEEYNIHDVVLLENVYIKMRPWIKSHPNVALYDDVDEKRCSCCGSSHIEPDGFYYTNVSKFQSYRCLDCGAACGRERKAIKRVQLTANAR